MALLICVKSGYFRSDVGQALLRVFSNRTLPDGRRGFFHPDNFTFGRPLYLSRVYEAALAVGGVESVGVQNLQRWGKKSQGEVVAEVLTVGPYEVIRLDNDPNFPENGKIEFVWRGACEWVISDGRMALERKVYIMAEEQALNDCGCCEGITKLTPRDLANPPGLSALAYRVGTHGSFKRTMLAGLAGPDGIPALTTRADEDPAIALLDATAVMLDVLTFYQGAHRQRRLSAHGDRAYVGAGAGTSYRLRAEARRGGEHLPGLYT